MLLSRHMKNAFVILGFIASAALGLALMQVPGMIKPDPWAGSGEHMKHVEAATSGVIDKCRLDRMQGRLKGHVESVECANGALKAAFLKEGYPDAVALDAFLAKRLDAAKKLDAKEIEEEDEQRLLQDALSELLDAVIGKEAKK